MANFFYYDQTNQKQGPVSEQQLKELAKQGVIGPHTPMVTDTGHKGVAGQIPGLFPAAPVQEPQPVPVPLVAPPPPPSVNLFCTNCGNSVSEKAVACMSCGAKPIGHKKFCRPCGVALNPEQVVCIKCGSALNTAGGFQSLGDGIKPVSDFLSTHNITAGEITVFAAAALAFISFILPWTEATVPMMGKVTSNGFSLYAFFLGLLFIHPVWMALKKKRTLHYKVRSYIWGGLGIIAGIALPRLAIGMAANSVYLVHYFSIALA
jgi:hypothetical protein